MGVVKGVIGIKDNATVVLKSIRKEQSEFRKDVEATRKELQRTWDKKFKVKIDTSAATGQMKKISRAIQPFRKKIVTAVAVKDIATAKVKAIGNKVKAIGKMVSKPIVSIKDATAAGLSKIKGGLGSIAKGVVIPVTAGVTAVIGGSIFQGAKLEQSIGGVETLFKRDAGIVKANADKAFQTAGLSANEYMETVTSFSASLLNSLGGDTGKSAKVADMAIIDMSDNANKFGTDMESIQNAYQGFAKQNYTMLDNLKLGYGGTKEEMSRLLTDATKLTGVKYDIDNLSNVYSAIHAIQENLGVTGTTAKEASETFSGSFAAMKSAASNLLGNLAIGGDVTSSMEQLVDSASTFLFNNAIPMVGRIVKALPSAIKTGIVKSAPKIKEAGSSIVKSLKEGMINFLPTSMKGMVEPLFGGIISVIRSSAPIISGLVQGISSAVSTLAPVWLTIFSSIGEKVGSVIGFVSERMGFIQEVISAVSPVLADILTTSWGVISPVIDICIGTFKLLFGVVQKVFPGIQKIITSVWKFVKPLIEGIGTVMQGIASGWNWLVDKVTGSGSSEVGANAKGTNNWKGGLTWVGEEGPELVDLPRGSRVLPHKESVTYSKPDTSSGNYQVPQAVRNQQSNSIVQQVKKVLSVTIAKLADTIIVREEADIDKIGTAVADKVVKIVLNTP